MPTDWFVRLHRVTDAQLEAAAAVGVQSIAQLPEGDPHYSWSPVQLRIIRATRRDACEVDHAELQSRLSRLQWPLAFVDFEYDPGVALPLYRGMRPYQRLPFQWSMQIQESPELPLRCVKPFLHDAIDDPRRGFIESLLATLPPSGNIVTHSHAAEEGVLNRYLQWFPGEFDEPVAALKSRIFDTCQLVRET